MELATTSNSSGSKRLISRARRLLGQKLGEGLTAKLFGPGLIALGIKVASAGLSYLMLVAFARMMDATAYGQFGVMLNIAIVGSSIAAIGLPTAVMRFWPSHIAMREPALARGFHLGAQKLLLLIAFCLLALGAIASAFGLWSEFFGSRFGAILVAALAGLFALGDYFANALRAQHKVLWSMVPRDILWRVVSPVLAALALFASGNVTAATSMFACIMMMALVVVAQFLTSARTAKELTSGATARTRWPEWRKPLWALAAASILYAMVQQLDVVVVGSLVGPAEAGAYFAAQKTASLLGLVMIAGGLIAAPMMSAAYQAGNHSDLQRLCKVLAFAIALSTLLGFVVLLLIGKPLLAIFDPAYGDAYVILVVLAVGYAIDALAGPTAYLMQMTSLEGTYLRIMAIVYAFVLALQFALVPRYGAVAAAGATALGVCLWNILSIYHLRKSIGIDSSILSFFLPARQA